MFSKAENHQNEKPLKERYDLIAHILNARIENEGLEEYQCILDNNFLEFASGVDSLKEKEIALLELQEIKKELQLVASYPSLFQKNMVAVGGGFSAGKSTFLNHLLGLNLKLTEAMEVATAIPTYLKITIQLEEIAVKTKETLEDNGIEFLGIGAYSSKRYQEIKEFSEKSPVFDSLEKFLTELNKKGEKQNEILSVLYEVGLAYEKAIKEDLSKFKRYQDVLHSIKLDLMQKGFDDFSDASFNKIESLKKEFYEQERSKRENLVQLNQVINLFKKSIDKVFNRVSTFTWEKYKEENDDEENDEENYQEFEEIKKMVLYFRDCWMFVVEQLDGKSSQTELQKYKGFVSRNNKLLQLEFSMKNLLTLRQFKDTYREWYSKLRQLNEAKEVVSELRDYWFQELPPSAKDLISYCSTLLKLDYSLENLQKLRRCEAPKR